MCPRIPHILAPYNRQSLQPHAHVTMSDTHTLRLLYNGFANHLRFWTCSPPAELTHGIDLYK